MGHSAKLAIMENPQVFFELHESYAKSSSWGDYIHQVSWCLEKKWGFSISS